MYVSNVVLKFYRNYEYADIKLNKEVNVIYGNNAQGKTNILESIYLFTTGKSYRTNKDKELIQFGQQYAKLKIEFNNRNGDNTGEIILSADQKKRIKVNEVPINKIGELMGFFNAVIFSPEDLDLVKSGPAQRRKFIDICISQLRPNYFYNLQKYLKVMQQRNNLLKSIHQKRSLKETLPIWEEELVQCGAKIILNRIAFIKKIRDIAERIHLDITRGTEHLKIQYRTNIGIDETEEDIDKIVKDFRHKLNHYRGKEIENGMTLIGPHRDDIYFMINDNHAKKFGSQGQQRTVVLSLKMAEMEYMKEEIGEYPILLLDDIMSELDRNRQHYIMNNITNRQVIITCTGIEGLKKNTNISFFKVENGKIHGG